MKDTPFSIDVTPDWQGLAGCILRNGQPRRVHFIELFLDTEIMDVIAERYGLLDGIDREDPFFAEKRMVAVQRFLGYDYVRGGLDDLAMPLNHSVTEDTAELPRARGRSFMDLHRGPITTWEEFKSYPWPDVAQCHTRALEWYQENLPQDMCIIASGGFAHFAEHLSWLMGYETLCYALYDQRDLVKAIADRILDIYEEALGRMLAFERIKIVWGSDDMGFRSGTLISPDDLREFVLPGHKRMAQMSHDAGRPYLLHSCGNLAEIMDDLIEDVRIDAKHSFEDTFEDVVTAHHRYGSRVALLGGIDVDFLCRADEEAVRKRVRDTLAACMPGGGYVLGTGNSVANYIPVDNYLAMLDEGRKFSG